MGSTAGKGPGEIVAWRPSWRVVSCDGSMNLASGRESADRTPALGGGGTSAGTQRRGCHADCPQGLADSPERMRVCERKVGAAGKTPCERPRDTSRPFAGFVLSGLELFDALHGKGLQLASSKNMAGRVGEVYPGEYSSPRSSRASSFFRCSRRSFS